MKLGVEREADVAMDAVYVGAHVAPVDDAAVRVEDALAAEEALEQRREDFQAARSSMQAGGPVVAVDAIAGANLRP